MSNNTTPIFGRLKNVTKEDPYVTGAVDIKDDVKNKNQQTINQETDEHLGVHDTEIADRYTKEEVNNIVSRTPETDAIVIEVPAASQSDIAGWLDANTPSGTDPETGRSVRANKLYRVPGPDNTTFSEWAWDGTKYIMLANKDYGVDDEPIDGSDNFVKSSGIYNRFKELEDETIHDFAIADKRGNNLAEFDDGHIRTKNFDSRDTQRTKYSSHSFSIGDENDNNIVEFDEGHIKTKNFDSRSVGDSIKYSEHKFSISDANGNNIAEFDDGHIKTKKFDSRNSINAEYSKRDFSISDEDGNNVVEFDEGEIKTQNFDSREVIKKVYSEHKFAICDEEHYNIVEFDNGHIKTKHFDSSLIPNNVPEGTLALPSSPIPIYITCNDIDKSNSWGIGSRNKALSVYLDHFFNTQIELGLYFSNKANYVSIEQHIVGSITPLWNDGMVRNEYLENHKAGNDTLSLKIRSILNSETKNVYPKVLQIGDSVTEGWFANYPIINGAPIQSWSWAKYYFEKDKQQYGSLFNSLFVGTITKNVVNYDGINYNAYAYGVGGKTAKWYCTNPDCAFYTNNGFSLASYLSKYKTLADDGVTRLVPGSTAGTEVTDATLWDLCTPNVVVIQLGMNDNLSEWKIYIPQIVDSIKAEFPDMKIIISVLDACTCNYPSLYPEYSGIFFDNYNGNHTKLLEAYRYAIDNWQDEINGVYVIYSGMVMPMPYSCNVREENYLFDGSKKRYVGVDSIERVPHPSRYAHAEIGYLLYSCLKWIFSV